MTARLDVELAIAEELDQHGLEQGLVGRLEGDDGERAQARAQVGHADTRGRPAAAREVSSTDSRLSRARFSRWNSACSSAMPAVEILHDERAASARRPATAASVRVAAARRARGRFEPPDVGEVALAGAPRPHDHASRVRPIGPAVDQLDRGLIGAG